jgi:hypothetical protein
MMAVGGGVAACVLVTDAVGEREGVIDGLGAATVAWSTRKV